MLTETPNTSEGGVATGSGLVVALPEPSQSLTQDAEWCVVQVDGEWRQIRFHDYAELFSIPGLYERVIYEILECRSPETVRGLIERELTKARVPARSLRVLDLGAGNGMVGEQLADMGAEFIVGVDIIEEAAIATERDRPGVYADYQIVDMTDLSPAQLRQLSASRFNCLTCVAALGFGDIPTAAFVNAYNLVEDGGWIAFNVKEDFLANGDRSGFAQLIQRIIVDKSLEVLEQERYPHRIGTDRTPIHYAAFVGRKHRSITL